MTAKIILVTGGARSGKSVFAEQYAKKLSAKVAYIATAQIYDEEMELRVDLHKKRRPTTWTTYEAPFHAEVSIKEAVENHEVILFDCITLYLSNLLLASSSTFSHNEKYDYILKEFATLLDTVEECKANIIFVTNEVGMGIVPENGLAREYRDFAGKINQFIAEKATKVFMVISGMGVDIKKLAMRLEEENG